MSEQTSTVTLEQDMAVKAPARGRWGAMARFFRPPTLRVVVHGERHASWLELFFDLVFVVAVAALGHLLHEDTTTGGFLAFAGLFVPVWWSWLGFSYYADQFDSDDMGFRLIMAGAMLGIILLAINIEAAAHGEATGFVLAYVLLRVLLIGLYAWARGTVPATRSLCTYVTRTTRYQGAIIRDHHILLIKQTEHATGRSYWLIPGGRIEPDETAENCVEREMLEETGLHVQVEYLLLDEPSLSYRRSGAGQDRGGATGWFLERAGRG